MGGGRWQAIAVSCLLFNLNFSIHAQNISDTLVENLSCSDLTVDSVFSHIREDAFSVKMHLPIFNRSTFTRKGLCSGLASFQRMFFYLARFEDRPFSSEEIREALYIMNGQKNIKPKNSKDPFEYKLIPRRVFSLPYYQDREESLSRAILEWNRFQSLPKSLEVLQFKKNFLPYLFTNTITVIGKSLKRNENVIRRVVKDLKRNRIHKLNFYMESGEGHAVLPTSIILEEENKIILGLYDPNSPESIVRMVWTPEKLLYFDGYIYENKPVFAGINDDAELALIERVLLRHYKTKCAEINNLSNTKETNLDLQVSLDSQ